MKYIIGILLFLICCSCQRQLSPDAIRICKELDQNRKNQTNTHSFSRIDSLLKLSADYPKRERLIILGKAIPLLAPFVYSAQTRPSVLYYINELSTTMLPSDLQKDIIFTILEFYGNTSLKIGDRGINIDKIVPMFFELECKQELTPKEIFRLLIAKTNIYKNIFEEYSTALRFCMKAESQARKNRSPEDIFHALEIRKNISIVSNNIPGILEATHKQLELIEKKSIPKDCQLHLYQTLCHYYLKQQNYQEARRWYSHLPASYFNLRFDRYLTEIYIGLDSLSAALRHLDKIRQNAAKYNTQVNQPGDLAYSEALIWKKAGDISRYNHCLHKSIRQYNIYRAQGQSKQQPLNYGYEYFASSQEYAALLWQQGKHQEAINQLKIIIPDLLSFERYEDRSPETQERKNSQITILHQLSDYYKQMQQQAKASHIKEKADSLQNIRDKAEYKMKQRQSTGLKYARELGLRSQSMSHDLEQQSIIQQLITVILGILLTLALIFGLIHHRGQKKLNTLYARQKEEEHPEQIATKTNIPSTRYLPDDEQLFRQLEKLLHEEKLFLNPDFSREDLCRLAGSNRMYVSSCINKYAGMNINQWLNKARINHAIQMIRENQTNIQVLAKASGFSSTTSFFRNFKQFTQLSPKQYIDQEKKGLPQGNKNQPNAS